MRGAGGSAVKLYQTVIAALAVGGMLLPGAVQAGALDRGPMQQRYNQAADEMIRVPGVLGMWEQDAMAVLQQAGVVPNIEYARTYREDLSGKEGTVIGQKPGAAGVTMLGSTVTITVYWPAAKEPIPETGVSGEQYDDGASQREEPTGSAPPPSYQEPVPEWGGGDQPAGGSGWTPPPVPAVEPRVEPVPAPVPTTPAATQTTPVQPPVTPVK